MKVCLAPFWLLWNSRLGGHVWVYLNWVLGCRDNGCDLVLLEILRPNETPEGALERLYGVRGMLESLEIEADVALLLTADQEKRLQPVREELDSLTIPLDAATEDADLLLSLIYELDPSVVSRFRRTAMVDIDPGLLQHWISEGQLHVTPHDLYFTIGETVGKPGAQFPDCGIDWVYTPPPVHLPSWPVTTCGSDAPLTTVGNWWGVSERSGEEVINNEKRTSFVEYLDLPMRTGLPLELTLFLRDERDPAWRELTSQGWRVRSSLEVCPDPMSYRKYIRDSRGEFSCAKPSCMRFQNAWVSDRTICYLASGKPVVVQHTGPSEFLPDAAGMFRFQNREEAIDALEIIEADYEAQCRLARVLAEEIFDAKKVVRAVLERVMDLKDCRKPSTG